MKHKSVFSSDKCVSQLMVALLGFYPDSIFLCHPLWTFYYLTGIFNRGREGYFVSLSYSIFEECRLTCCLLCMAYMMYVVGMMRDAPMAKRLTSSGLVWGLGGFQAIR